MNIIELAQLPQHDFDLGIRDKADATDNDLFSGYHEIIAGEPLDDEHRSRFEKALIGLIGSNAAHVGLLHEMNFASVEPADAIAILEENRIPNDAILDEIAKIRGALAPLIDDYVAQIDDMNLVSDSPEARERLARYVLAAVLFDDRDPEDA